VGPGDEHLLAGAEDAVQSVPGVGAHIPSTIWPRRTERMSQMSRPGYTTRKDCAATR
jgi:hypothetical protein